MSNSSPFRRAKTSPGARRPGQDVTLAFRGVGTCLIYLLSQKINICYKSTQSFKPNASVSSSLEHEEC